MKIQQEILQNILLKSILSLCVISLLSEHGKKV